MSYGSGICDPGTANAHSLCRARPYVPAFRGRSRYSAPAGLPPVYATATLGLGLGVRHAYGRRWPTYTKADGSTAVVSFDEQHRSRDMDVTENGASLTRRYIVTGSDDPAAVIEVGPQIGDKDVTYPALIATHRHAKWYGSGGRADGSGAGGEAALVLVEVTFTGQNDNNSGETPEPTFAYEFGAETEHVEKAIAQSSFGREEEDARVGLLVNLTPDGVDGVDIQSPILDVTEEHTFKEEDFTPAFRKLLRDNVQKVNSAPFREFKAGEALLQGVSARKAGKYWQVNFSFRVRRNVKQTFALTENDGTQTSYAIDKLGWEYLWISTIKRTLGTDDDARVEIVPHAVHVAQVYERVDFAILNIGTEPLP